MFKNKIFKRTVSAALTLVILMSAALAGAISVLAEETGGIAESPAGPTYKVFGEEIPYALSEDGLKLSEETLANAGAVIENAAATDREIVLCESIKDFKLSYKFKNGELGAPDGENIYAPVMATLRDDSQGSKILFGNKFWSNDSDINLTFYENGEKNDAKQHRDQWGGGAGWHTVDIIMLGNRLVIRYDGIRWHDSEVSNLSAGRLALRLRYAGTKICDVKVEGAASADLDMIVDADFVSDATNVFNLWYNYNYSGTAATHIPSEGAMRFTSKGGAALKLEGIYWNTPAAEAENITFETEFKFEGGLSWQQGFYLKLFGDTISINVCDAIIRVGPTDGSNAYGSKDIASLAASGIYHKLKAVIKENLLQVFLDDEIIITYEGLPADRAASTVKFLENIPDGGYIYLKNIKALDNTDNIARKAYMTAKYYNSSSADPFGAWSSSEWTPTVIDGVAAKTCTSYGGNGASDIRINGSLPSENWSFKMKFHIKDESIFDGGNYPFYIQLRSGMKFNMLNGQYMLGGWEGSGITISADNGNSHTYTPFDNSSVLGKWSTLEIIFIDNHVIVDLNGVINTFTASGSFGANTETSDRFFVYGTCTNLSVGELEYSDVTELKTAIDAVAAVPETITAESAEEIDTASKVYKATTKAERNYVIGNSKLINAVAKYKELTGEVDANLDGTSDIRDLISLKKTVLGIKAVNFMCDLNGDELVNANDLVIVRKALLK